MTLLDRVKPDVQGVPEIFRAVPEGFCPFSDGVFVLLQEGGRAVSDRDIIVRFDSYGRARRAAREPVEGSLDLVPVTSTWTRS